MLLPFLIKISMPFNIWYSIQFSVLDTSGSNIQDVQHKISQCYILQVDDMVDMYEDTRSKYEAVLEHMKERICDRYITPFDIPQLSFEFPERRERFAASPPRPPCLGWGGRQRCWGARRTPAQESPTEASPGRTPKAASDSHPTQSPTPQTATSSSTMRSSWSATMSLASEELAALLEG